MAYLLCLLRMATGSVRNSIPPPSITPIG